MKPGDSEDWTDPWARERKGKRAKTKKKRKKKEQVHGLNIGKTV